MAAKWMAIPGWLTVEEGYWLVQLARAVLAGGLIVEVGSWKGRSTVALGCGSAGKRLVAIDHFRGSGEQGHSDDPDRPRLREIFEDNLRRAGLTQVEIVEAESLAVARDWSAPIDLLFLDGSHDYESVRADVAAWWSHVRPGGVMVCHDYDQEAFPGVRQAVDEAGLPGRLIDGTSLFVAIKEDYDARGT